MSGSTPRSGFELLAPAGTFAILAGLLDSGADAFYCGGKSLNMRLHRGDYNLSDAELVEAGRICRAADKRLYVTVNRLLGGGDLAGLPVFLDFLAEQVRPDAILVQDWAVVDEVRRRGLPLPMHASVMMNVHNAAMARSLRDLGVVRAVLSRELSLEECASIGRGSGLETEYFVHGDMCVSNGSLCLYSSLVFGHSSNRGLCMKPCRWPFAFRKDGQAWDKGFPLAVRDMAMYAHIPALAKAGISSLKIEGRMRNTEYLRGLIEVYADALARYAADPGGFVPGLPDPYFEERRLRDLSPAFAFGNPGASFLNTRWEGTGKFYSTGRVFSVATDEPERSTERVVRVSERLAATHHAGRAPVLVARVDGQDQAMAALESGADLVVFSADPFLPRAMVTPEELSGLKAAFPGRRFALALPRMLSDGEMEGWPRRLDAYAGLLDELMVSFVGADEVFSSAVNTISGDYPLNVLNARAARFLASRGFSSLCLSAEAPLEDLAEFLQDWKGGEGGLPALEIIVAGRVSAMYIDLDLHAIAAALPHVESAGSTGFSPDVLCLEDEKGRLHPLARDSRGRCHFLPTRSLDLGGLVPALHGAGITRFRVEGGFMEAGEVGRRVADLRAGLDGLGGQGRLAEPLPGTTLGALHFDR